MFCGSAPHTKWTEVLYSVQCHVIRNTIMPCTGPTRRLCYTASRVRPNRENQPWQRMSMLATDEFDVMIRCLYNLKRHLNYIVVFFDGDGYYYIHSSVITAKTFKFIATDITVWLTYARLLHGCEKSLFKCYAIAHTLSLQSYTFIIKSYNKVLFREWLTSKMWTEGLK